MDLLEKLCMASGVSGFESEIRDVMKKELRKSCAMVEEDSFGNIIATKGKGKRKIMLAAHMDEIGLMVKHINKKGFISFIKLGSIDNRLLLNQRVLEIDLTHDLKGGIREGPDEPVLVL